LKNHYESNFNLHQYHKYTLVDIENMLPWERSIHIDLIKEVIRKQKEQARDTKMGHKVK